MTSQHAIQLQSGAVPDASEPSTGVAICLECGKPMDSDHIQSSCDFERELAELRRREHKKLHGTCRMCPTVWTNADGYCRNHMPKEDKWKGYK